MFSLEVFLQNTVVYIFNFTVCAMSLAYIILRDLIYLTVLSGDANFGTPYCGECLGIKKRKQMEMHTDTHW
jgi:hypothetical protein